MPPPVVLLLFIDFTFPFKSRSGAAGAALGLFVFYRPMVASWKTLGALLGAQTAGLGAFWGQAVLVFTLTSSARLD